MSALTHHLNVSRRTDGGSHARAVLAFRMQVAGRETSFFDAGPQVAMA